ncbi:MAG: hypothetical protein HC892_20575 [Saprospiraceae bacterium]|nr:hypothetical protein [Saprospiraceae bacterium]
MKLKRKQWIGIVGIIISVIACYVVFEDIDYQTLLKTTQQIPFLYLLIIGLFYLATPLLRAYRWQLTLPNHQKYLNGVVIGFAGNNVLPARGGELDAVLGGVRAARAAGMAVKINTVALKGVNEDERQGSSSGLGARLRRWT